MALDTYTGLKAEIESHVRRDLASRVDTFIDIAEARHKRDIRLREQLYRQPIVIVDRYMDLPSRFASGKSIRILTNPVRALQHVTQEKLDRIRKDTTGTPTSYTVHSQIEFDCDPATNYKAEIIYYRTVHPLSDDVDCNDILLLVPEAYLYGALLAAAPWLHHDERIQTWKTLYDDAVNRANVDTQDTIGTPIARVPQVLP